VLIDETLLEMVRSALIVVLKVATPILGAGIVVGLAISIFQSVTSIQEQTLSFVPKLVAVGAVFLLLFSWMLQLTMQFTVELLVALPTFVF